MNHSRRQEHLFSADLFQFESTENSLYCLYIVYREEVFAEESLLSNAARTILAQEAWFYIANEHTIFQKLAK